MPLSTQWNRKKKKKPPPKGFDFVEPVLEVLENESRDKVKETDPTKRKLESNWPIHQINWQKSRYIYDMYYTYHKINRAVYQYCLDMKLVDSALIAKWKKPGYERLCSTYVINSQNYKFGTTSICRVPWQDRNPDQMNAKDPTTGCMGCASGKGGGPQNIFGNKYGQNLAAVQVAREKRQEEKLQKEKLLRQKQEEEQRKKQAEEAAAAAAAGDDDETEDDDDQETDDDEDDDYGPSPAAGIWAGTKRLEKESEQLLANDDDEGGEAETDDDDDDDEGAAAATEPPMKKVRTDPNEE